MGFDDTGLGAAMAQSYAEGLGRDANKKADQLAVMVTILMDRINGLDAEIAELRGRAPRPVG